MRNALTPVITLGALEFGTLLSGAVLTEQIFTIPGFGKLIIDAVFNRDYARGAGRRAGHGDDLHRAQSARRHRLRSRQSAAAHLNMVGHRRRTHSSIAASENRRNAPCAAPRAGSSAAKARSSGWSLLRSLSRWLSSRHCSRPTTRRRKAGPRCAIRPSAAHWFGTDDLGRDILARIIFGTRASLLAGVISVGIALFDRRAARA